MHLSVRVVGGGYKGVEEIVAITEMFIRNIRADVMVLGKMG